MQNKYIEDLVQSFGMLRDSFQQIGMQRAISQANNRVQEIRDSGLEEDQKQAEFRNLAQDTTLRLMGSGASGAQIEAFQNAFSPKQAPIQTAEQAVIMGNSEQRERGQQLIQQKQQFTKEENRAKIDAQLEGLGLKQTAAEKKQVSNSLMGFQKVAKAELDGLDTLATAPEDITNNLEYVATLKQLIKRTDPRISDADFKLSTPNTDLQSRTKRAWDALVENKPLPQDAEAVKNLMSIIKNKTEARLDEKIKGYSSAQYNANQFRTVDQPKFENMLRQQWYPSSSSLNQQQQQPAMQNQQGQSLQQQVPAANVGPSKYFR